MSDLSYNPLPNPDVLFQHEEGGWAVLVNYDTGNSVCLNPTGVFIWKKADGKKSVSEIIAMIRDAFSDVPADINCEIVEMVENLKAQGFFGYEIKL